MLLLNILFNFVGWAAVYCNHYETRIILFLLVDEDFNAVAQLAVSKSERVF